MEDTVLLKMEKLTGTCVSILSQQSVHNAEAVLNHSWRTLGKYRLYLGTSM